MKLEFCMEKLFIGAKNMIKLELEIGIVDRKEEENPNCERIN